MKTCSAYHWNRIGTETRQRINAVHCGRGIYLSLIYLIIKLFVCIKDRTWLRMAIPAYCFNIFE